MVDNDARKMLDDLDARLLLDANAEARHAEALSLASMAAAAAFLGGLSAVASRSNLGTLGAFVVLSPGVMVFGMTLLGVGMFLRDRVNSAAKRADTALARLATRHLEARSELPNPQTVTLAAGATQHRYDGRSIPKAVVVLGGAIAALAAWGTLLLFLSFFAR